MKKIWILLLMLLMLFSFWGCQKEKEKVTEITILHSGPAAFLNGSDQFKMATEMFTKDYPEVKINLIQIDLSDGSTLTMDAMLAAGNAPNIYVDTLVRASKYITPDFALPLDDYVRDLNQYQEGVLNPYRRNGNLLALPIPGSAQGMAINLDIMREIDFNVSWDWTIDEFLIMAEKVKNTFGGTKWATGMFAANQSGDYLINNWFASFGCEYYQNGDYSHTTIKETGGEKIYEFFQHLVEYGYLPPGCSTLTDDDYVIQWAKGDLAASAFFQSWTDPYFKTVLDQGLAEKRFEYMFVPFPRGKGVDSVSTYMMNGAIVVHKTGTPADSIAARYAEYLNCPQIQIEYAKLLSIPNRTDVDIQIQDPRTAEIMNIVSENGLFDVGLSMEKFALTRPQHYPILQRVLNLDISPQEAINLYEQKINEVLK